MARFRGTLQGQRGLASRLGSASSGLHVTCDGWHSGVRVTARATGPNTALPALSDKDVFTIEATSGSGYNDGQRFTIGYVYLDKKGRLVFKRPVSS